METSSVSAATSVVQQQLAPSQPQEAPRPRESQQPTQVQAASNQNPPQRAERPEQAQQPQAPQPVVNAQGQKTGSIINTTA
jgi:hypothetical protein